MVNNSTNINKTNNNLSPKTTEHNEHHTAYDVGNLGPGVAQSRNVARFR